MTSLKSLNCEKPRVDDRGVPPRPCLVSARSRSSRRTTSSSRFTTTPLVRLDNVAVRSVGRLEMLDQNLALVKQFVDVLRTEILQALEPSLFLRKPEPLAVVGLLVRATFYTDAV